MSTALDTTVRSLATLLADDDARVRRIARKHLLHIGDDGAATLRTIIRSDADGKMRIAAARLLEEMQRDDLLCAFHLISLWPDHAVDAEHGAYLIAKSAYPELKKSEISQSLSLLARSAHQQIEGHSSPRRIIRGMNRAFFREAGFFGNHDDYHDPDNSFLNRVLETRAGIPVTLALIYMLVARRLDLPIYGLNTPMHFLCVYEDRHETLYINPFDRGRIMGLPQCVEFLRSYGVSFQDIHLRHATDREILIRMIKNLILIYYNNGEERKAAFMKKVLKVMKSYAKQQEKR